MKKDEALIIGKERNFSDIITDSFTLVRHGIKSLGKAILFVTGPMILVVAIFLGLFSHFTLGMSNFFTNSLENGTPPTDPLGQYTILAGVIYFLIIMVSILIMIFFQSYSYSYMKLYNEMDYKEITFRDVMKEGKNHTRKLLFTNIGMWFLYFTFFGIMTAVFIGGLTFLGEENTVISVAIIILMTVLFFFAIYIMILLTIVPPVRVFETVSFFGSIKRSFSLLFGNFWNTFGLLIILNIIISTISIVFIIPYFVVSIVLAFHSVSGGAENLGNLKPLISLFYSLYGLSFFLYVLQTVAIGFKFFSVRDKKEGTSLIEKIDSLSQENSI